MSVRLYHWQPARNVNPQGCNQHTGPGCSGGGVPSSKAFNYETSRHTRQLPPEGDSWAYRKVDALPPPTQAQRDALSHLVSIAGKGPHEEIQRADGHKDFGWNVHSKDAFDKMKSWAEENGHVFMGRMRGGEGEVSITLHPKSIDQRMEDAGKAQAIDWRPEHSMPEDFYANRASAWIPVSTWQPVANRFCATGKGGGVDPHCTKDPGSSPAPLPDPDDLTKVKDLPGSTGPRLVKDKNGKQWVQKSAVPGSTNKTADHLHNEAQADALYRVMGVSVPHSGVAYGYGADSVHKLSEYHEGGQTLDQWEKGKSHEEITKMHKEIAKGFVADALLANWDVAGLSNDNILITSDGKPMRIDNGGALKYRAQGAPKGSKFGSSVGELKTLRNAATNPTATRIFKHLTNDEIHSQIKDVLSKRDEILKAVKDPATKEILSKRLDDLQSKLGDYGEPATVPTPIPVAAPAVVALTSPPSLPVGGVHPLHTGEGLTQHIHDNKGDIKFDGLHLAKIKHLNPEGVKNGVINVPNYSTGSPSDVKKMELLKKILPAGTIIKSKSFSNKDLTSAGVTEWSPGASIPSSALGTVPSVSTSSGGAGGLTATPSPVKAKSPISASGPMQPLTPNADGHIELLDVSAKPKGLTTWKSSLTANQKKASRGWLEVSLWKPHTAGSVLSTSRASLLRNEKAAAHSWQGGGQAAIRKKIAKGRPNDEANSFMAAISKGQPYTGIVYRGVSSYGSNPDEYGNKLMAQLEAAGVGGTYSEKFPSCMSRDPAEAMSFAAPGSATHPSGIYFRIKTKSGCGIENLSTTFAHEKEIVIHPNKQYRIVGLTRNPKLKTKDKYKAGAASAKHVKMLVELEEI